MDGSGRANRGDRRIRTDVWNRLVDASEIVHRERFSGGGANAEVLRAKNILLVRNDTGADVPRGGILAITGIVTDPAISSTAKESFFDAPTMSGSTPTTGTRDFGVTLEAIRNGVIGRVALGGVFTLKVDITDTDHHCACPKASRNAMKSCGEGPVRLLWKEYSTGNDKWALGAFNTPTRAIVFSKTESFWAKNTQAVLSVHDAANEVYPVTPKTTTPPEQVTAVNLMGPVPADRWVVLGRGPGGWYFLISAEC